MIYYYINIIMIIYLFIWARAQFNQCLLMNPVFSPLKFPSNFDQSMSATFDQKILTSQMLARMSRVSTIARLIVSPFHFVWNGTERSRNSVLFQ
jgi:hypothetical protein